MAALKLSNYFAVLGSEELLGSESIPTNEIPNEAPTLLHQLASGKKKQETRRDIAAALMRAKPILGRHGVSMREREIRRPNQKLINSDHANANAMQNHQAVTKEYEKEQLGKEKATAHAKFTAGNGRGTFTRRFSRQDQHRATMKVDRTLNIEDRSQFPTLT